MSKLAKALTAAAGNAGAGGESVYVDDVFSTYLYTGADANETVTNGIDLDGEGGFVWIKPRTSTGSHLLFDTERGTGKYLVSSSTAAEATYNPYLSSFNSDGFTTFAFAPADYVSWTFRKQAGFFDVVTYTGNGTAGRTVSHNLGSVPGCIIVKRTDSANGWAVYHRAMDATAPEDWMMRLNATNARFDLTPSRWNDTAPTSTDFTLSDNDEVNGSGATYVAYLFAHDDQSFGDDSDESIIKCGSYTGNATERSVTLGWEPQFVMIKNTDNADDWWMVDNMRGVPTGSEDALLIPNKSDEENSNADYIDFNSRGFTVKTSYGIANENGSKYIYIAIRRPMKTPESGTEVFAIDTRSADDPAFDSGFPVDMALYKSTAGSDTGIGSRLTSGYQLATNLTSAESAYSRYVFDYMDGWFLGGLGADSARYSWMFKRATGFFDVVAYRGTGATGQVESHNLGAVPEMIIVKNRGSSWQWVVYHKDLGEYDSGSWVTSSNLTLNSDGAETNNYVFSQHSDQTNTTFKLGYSNSAIAYASGNNYIAYLFATLAGVSKVGSYTGTGSDINVDCGFSSAARFVLIKRTDASAGWIVFDSSRGIVSGNDPYLFLNSTAAESTTDDMIDPYSSGFTVHPNGTAINTSGGEYIFLAIA